MMNNKTDIDESLKTLQGYSILTESEEEIKGEDTIQLTNFLMDYLQLDDDEKLNFMKMISYFFAESLTIVYQNIKSTDYDNYPVQQSSTATTESVKVEIAQKKDQMGIKQQLLEQQRINIEHCLSFFDKYQNKTK